MPEEQIPSYIGHRERLRNRFQLGHGKDMADYELLELLLTYALPRKDTKVIAKNLVKHFGSIAKVISASPEELSKISGIKNNSAILLNLIKVITEKASWCNLCENNETIITNYDQMIDYVRLKMSTLDIEEFHLIYLNSKMHVIGEETLQTGTIDKVAIHPREVILSAIEHKAKALILAHNHPSGDTRPSKEDIMITEQIIKAAEVVDLLIIDHLIVSKNNVLSFRDMGIVQFQQLTVNK